MFRAWRLTHFLLFLILTPIGGFGAMPFRAQPPSSTILYAENFDDGLAQNWSPGRGGQAAWLVDAVNGDGRWLAQGPAQAAYTQAEWGDSVLEFRFNPAEITGGLRVHFRRSAQGGYWLDLLPTVDTIEGVSFLEVRLYPFYETLGPAGGDNFDTLVFDPGIEYEGRIAVEAGIIKVAIEPAPAPRGPLVLRLQPTPTPRLIHHDQSPPPPGAIGFEVPEGGAAWVDDLMIFGPSASATYFLDGQVLVSANEPVSGALLELFAARRTLQTDAPRLDRVTTGENGRFRLRAALDRPAQRYSVQQTDLPGYESLSAEPGLGGVLISANWLEFPAPLWEHELDRIIFWDRRTLPSPTPTTTSTSTDPPSATTTELAAALPSDTPAPTTPVPSLTPTLPVATATATRLAAVDDDDDDDQESVLWLLGGVLLLALGGAAGGGYMLWRLLRRPHEPPASQPPDRPPDSPRGPLPVFPPVRLVRVWLSEGAGGGRPLNDRTPLRAGAPYSLHAQIPALPGAADQPPGGVGEAEALTLMVFALDDAFEVDRSPAILRAPARQAGNAIRRTFTPQRTGPNSLRVCVYYGNVLLQSVRVDVNVTAPDAPPGAASAEGVRRVVDYVANATLTDLRRLPQPALSIFTNQAVDGTHWIGVYAAAGQSAAVERNGPPLPSGLLLAFSEDELKERARTLRELFSVLQGPRPYRYRDALPLDAARLARLENDLVRLATAGWKVFNSLFLTRVEREDYPSLPDARRPGVVSIARCRAESPTLPWAALYDLRLETEGSTPPHLCPVFKAQLQANQWDPAGGLVHKQDLLDNPTACRRLADCPLNGPERTHVVCPFGFWGLLHEIEQPLQAVSPTPVGRTPPELERPEQAAAFEQAMFVNLLPDRPVQILAGAYPGIADAIEHCNELRQLAVPGRVNLTWLEDRNQVLRQVEAGDQHLYYFYCHGVVREDEFRLMLGPLGQPLYLGASDFDPREVRWAVGAHPLFVLNGCETMRVTPELIHGFLGILRQMGASGVVGSEMPVSTLLARPVGSRLVAGLLAGFSIGETFLQIRRDLLRQGNPLGLAYSFYSPAALHLHTGESCGWCQTRLPG